MTTCHTCRTQPLHCRIVPHIPRSSLPCCLFVPNTLTILSLSIFVSLNRHFSHSHSLSVYVFFLFHFVWIVRSFLPLKCSMRLFARFVYLFNEIQERANASTIRKTKIIRSRNCIYALAARVFLFTSPQILFTFFRFVRVGFFFVLSTFPCDDAVECCCYLLVRVSVLRALGAWLNTRDDSFVDSIMKID